jgi:hypothetical protein
MKWQNKRENKRENEMIKELFKNKDLIVFWTAMTIAACDLLSTGFFAIQEVIAAPAPVVTVVAVAAAQAAAEDAVAQRWAERMARLSAR